MPSLGEAEVARAALVMGWSLAQVRAWEDLCPQHQYFVERSVKTVATMLELRPDEMGGRGFFNGKLIVPGGRKT